MLAREKLLPVRSSEEVVSCRLSVVRERGHGWRFLMLREKSCCRVRNSAFSQGIGLQFKILHAGYPVAFQILPDTTDH
jgi:hypothetical protein